MNITTNAIGNYTPVRPGTVRQVQQKVKSEPKIEEPALNTQEKNFFNGLYPENQSEIAEYHFYNKAGSMLGVSKGSLFDRRG